MAIRHNAGFPHYKPRALEKVVEAGTGLFCSFFDELVEVLAYGLARVRVWLKRDGRGA